jgi:ribonuclease T2
LAGLHDFTPKSLAMEEWSARGACSGLAADAYFNLARRATAAIVIPPDLTRPGVMRRLTPQQIEADFVDANPDLTVDGVAVDCRHGVFAGIRICLTKQLAFRPCAEVDASGCRGASLAIPEVD